MPEPVHYAPPGSTGSACGAPGPTSQALPAVTCPACRAQGQPGTEPFKAN